MSDESLIRQLTASLKCEVCGQLYAQDDVSVLGHDENIWVLQVSCAACHSQSMLAALVEEEANEGLPEAIIDLLETEVGKFQDCVITSDDVLDMLIFLHDFQGDISQLLDQI